MYNKTTTLQNVPRAFKVTSLNLKENGAVYSVQGHEIFHGHQVGSSTTLLLPGTSIITDSETYQHCPELKEGVILYAVKTEGGLHKIISPSFTVQKKTVGCDGAKIEIQSSVGEAGPKGQKGDSGFGADGDKGEKGSVGDKGETGEKGSKGQKGTKGEEGNKGSVGGAGSKGANGDNIDWNQAGQNSIEIGGITFGPRLIGVCKDGEYKYVYVFGSDPQ